MRTTTSSEETGATPREEMPSIPSSLPAPIAGVSPNLCLSLVEFKGTLAELCSTNIDMLRQSRNADDGVTLRLNRAVARARDLGTSAPPSLLQGHDRSFSSSSALDLGRTTYSNADENTCIAFWHELVDLWMRREDTIRYCIAVNAQQSQPAFRPATGDDRLDLDRASVPPPPAAPPRGEATNEFIVRFAPLILLTYRRVNFGTNLR